MDFKRRPTYYFITLVVAYIILTLFIPPNQAVLHQYDISSLKARILSITVVIPLVGIWFAAFYGFTKLVQYAEMIKKNKDGKHVMTIAHGLGVLALGLPANAVVSSTLNILARTNADMIAPAAIVTHYLSVAVPLIAFIIISGGTRGLVDHIKFRPSRPVVYSIFLLFTIVGVAYCYFIFTGKDVRDVYHLSLGVLTVTLIVPYLFTWFIGMFSAAESYLYSLHSPGIIYKKSWQLLSAGLGSVIFTYVLLQYITTLTNRLSRLKIGVLMLVIYGLLLLLSSGFILIALGAKKLQKIEEV